MLTNQNQLLTVLCFLLLSACATQKPQYRNEADKQNIFPDKEIENTFYLVGDAGLSPLNGTSEVLTAFEKHISNNQNKKDYILFLGDNIYPSGLPTENHKDRKAAEHSLNMQIESVKNFKGKTIFIPGNHDWYANGLEGLKAQEKYIENALGKNTFLPENGCPIESIDVNENIQLLIVDSQWYLEDWNKHPTINDDCDIKTHSQFFDEIKSEIKKAQTKTLVFAIHHPLFTNGSHGGQFSADKHLFPFQSKLPLPIFASLITQLRSQGGVSSQDRYNEKYNDLMTRIKTLATGNGNIVFVSGHEHGLQYIENDGIKQVVSGAGSKESAVALNNDGLFSYGKLGFAELTNFKDGSSWIRYFASENGESILLFQQEIIKPKTNYDVSNLPDTFPQTLEVSVYSEEETNKSDFFTSVWGNHYRDIYGTKIKAKVATLDTLYGGVDIVRKGGGNQTRSLRLKAKNGKEYSMRAVKKSATQYLQSVVFKNTYVEDDFEQTEVENLVLDFYTAAHPYVYGTIPKLSKAVDVFYNNSELFYVPKQKHLGDFNADFGDELYLIEERQESNLQHYDNADDMESSMDIIAKVRKDEKYKIDEIAYIRARLFDMLIGDWDRHQDQWRWAQFDQDNGDKLYKPIPRDRDQAFSNFDGALLDVVKLISPASKQLQVYDSTMTDIKWMNSAGIKLDRMLVQKSGKESWMQQADFLQNNLTDAVIEEAFNDVPIEVQDKTLAEIKQKLKGRRANIKDIAERYYAYLNSLAIITATDKDDYIEINRIADKQTQVKISRIKNGEKGEVIIDRIYDKNITKEIWVYGLDDKDVFEVFGEGKNPIFTRIVGGQNNDTYIIKNGKNLKIYDHKTKKNTISENKGANINLTDNYQLNLFDYQKNILKTNTIAPSFGFNPDDGFKLGLSNTYTVKGFKRNPFSQQHIVRAGYYFATDGFDIRYNGEFAQVFGDWNLQVNAVVTSENFTNNFFGYGNETVNNDDDLDLDYNRVRTGIYALDFGIVKHSDFGSTLGFKVLFEDFEIEDVPNRFITDFIPVSNSEFYEHQFFGGLEAEFAYESVDQKINPTRGMTYSLNIGGKTKLDDTENTFGFLNSNLGFYNAISTNRKLVLKTDVRTQLRLGNDIVFYQAANIGGNNGLRGYRTERFTGQNSLVSSADLRYSFNSFKTSVLPLQFGVFGGFDVGRVWVSNEDSDKWHNDYGGGFWVTAAETISGTFNLFNSTEGLRFSFGFGINF
jgi:hypothetical protein